jgi:uroporphyrin-III C-methyltransferase/precorrin-2 dehydrogenase/sirohydrochlorin ferrochelatase
MLPKGFARWATAAAEWRAAVKASGLSFAGRRRFWQRFTAYAIRHPDRTRVQDHLSRFMAEIGGVGEAVEKGSVILVGAGPGDPELLTLRAVRALQGADVILFDDLVSGDVLDFARREAKKLLVGKTGHGPSCQQSDISALMIGLARQGKRVVRLKGGDPLIFARATEEITACKRAGFDVEIVPGITAAQGAAARLGMPLTERGIAQRLQFITGHASDGRLPADINWQSLIDPKTTTAIYMPKATLVEFNENAIANGLDAATPAIAIARATCPDQVVVKATIGDLPRSRELGGIGGPLLVIVGKVCDEAALVLPERIDGKARLPSAPNSLFLV